MSKFPYNIIHNVDVYITGASYRKDYLFLFIVGKNSLIELTRKAGGKKLYKLLLILSVKNRRSYIIINGRSIPIVPELDIFSIYLKLFQKLKDVYDNQEDVKSDHAKKLLETYLAFNIFFQSIPDEYLKIVKSLDQVFWWRNLFLLLNEGSRAVDLYSTTPALFLALANHQFYIRRTHHSRVCKQLLSKQHVFIAGYLGFPGDKTTIKIFRKLPKELLKINFLSILKLVLADPYLVVILKHLSQYNKLLFNFLYIIKKREGLLRINITTNFSYFFLNEISELKDTNSESEKNKIGDWASVIFDLYFSNLLTPLYSISDIQIPHNKKDARKSIDNKREFLILLKKMNLNPNPNKN